MRFALLLAAVAAVKITIRDGPDGDGPDGPDGPPTCPEIADHIWEACDHNGDEDITWKEA